MFGAGCFWGMEAALREVDGVTATAVGYSGGNHESPAYEDVCATHTGHAEVVEVECDPAVVTYEGLLEVFWQVHDPTQLNRQGPDVGDQYRSAIFPPGRGAGGGSAGAPRAAGLRRRHRDHPA